MSAIRGIVVLLSLLALLSTKSDAGFLMHKIHTVITNGLSGGLDLTLHCKSRDDDLGQHLLHSNETYDFTFRPYFWGTTLYYCSFQWNGAFHWFDIYSNVRDHDKCTLCKWIIRAEGPCRFNYKTGSYDDCFPWNKS